MDKTIIRPVMRVAHVILLSLKVRRGSDFPALGVGDPAPRWSPHDDSAGTQGARKLVLDRVIEKLVLG